MLNLKGPCEIHGRFSRCKDAPVGICVYCGRRFCSSHGERLPDLSEVCNRDVCVAKKLWRLACVQWPTLSIPLGIIALPSSIISKLSGFMNRWAIGTKPREL